MASSSANTWGGKEEEDERIKRKGTLAITSRLLAERDKIAWCMVGTAVYQVGLTSSICEKNFKALKPLVQCTSPPCDKGAKMPAISPWIWNKGITFKPRSEALNAVLFAMCWAEAQTLRCVSGTILGRDVVPEVCSTKATSSAYAMPAEAAVAACLDEVSSVNEPAPRAGVGKRYTIDTPNFSATATAGDAEPFSTTSALAFRSFR